MTWLYIAIGWPVLSIIIAALYSLMRTAQKRREARGKWSFIA